MLQHREVTYNIITRLCHDGNIPTQCNRHMKHRSTSMLLVRTNHQTTYCTHDTKVSTYIRTDIYTSKGIHCRSIPVFDSPCRECTTGTTCSPRDRDRSPQSVHCQCCPRRVPAPDPERPGTRWWMPRYTRRKDAHYRRFNHIMDGDDVKKDACIVHRIHRSGEMSRTRKGDRHRQYIQPNKPPITTNEHTGRAVDGIGCWW